MNRRKFVVASTVFMVLAAATVAGLAIYSTYVVKASIPDPPRVVRYLPRDFQAVFGMNVKKFIDSPAYAKFEEKHGKQFGSDLAEFIAKTGVDPRTDIFYIVAGGKSLEGKKGQGVILAVGQFNVAAIMAFINSYGAPITVDYGDAKVYMIPDKSGDKVDKGIAFLGEGEIALGDLESLKAILDVRGGKAKGIEENPVLAPLLNGLDPREMFWFAGDTANILSRAPTNTPLGSNISAVLNIIGTLNLTDAVSGKIVVTARDQEAARKLADVARGLVALGELAGEQNPELLALIKGISITQEDTKISLTINFPLDLLEKLERAKPVAKKIV